jgi:hypothetical protein
VRHVETAAQCRAGALQGPLEYRRVVAHQRQAGRLQLQPQALFQVILVVQAEYGLLVRDPASHGDQARQGLLQARPDALCGSLVRGSRQRGITRKSQRDNGSLQGVDAPLQVHQVG